MALGGGIAVLGLLLWLRKRERTTCRAASELLHQARRRFVEAQEHNPFQFAYEAAREEAGRAKCHVPEAEEVYRMARKRLDSLYARRRDHSKPLPDGPADEDRLEQYRTEAFLQLIDKRISSLEEAGGKNKLGF
jgi:hypothetical protein